METAVISYRVADFLRRHPPFNAIDDADLLGLAAHGRVRFFEPNEYLLWQGEPHRHQIFVIQQGTVALWDEANEHPSLRDVRGAGDLLGTERYNGAPFNLYSARSESDVVIYAFPAEDFDAHVLSYPHAAQYVAAESRVTTDYQPVAGRRDARQTFLHAIVGGRTPATCSANDSIADAARRVLTARGQAVAVVDAEQRARGILTPDMFLTWIAAGGGDPQGLVESLLSPAPATVAPDASVADGVLAMGMSGVSSLAITTDGKSGGRFQGLVTSSDLSPVFGEQPASLLREIPLAASVRELRELNQRSRAFVLEGLTGPASVDWLTRLATLIDTAIVTRVIALSGEADVQGCWCVYGSSGRGESLASVAPDLALVVEDDKELETAADLYRRVADALTECDYLQRSDRSFEPSFYVATDAEWSERYRRWVDDPVMQQMYRARSLFDLRPFRGRMSLWNRLETTVMDTVDSEFLHVLANDCLATLPPLTFFQDAVVDSVGEQLSTFHLERSALEPLVDVGRVFGMAARQVMGRSTAERLATARTLLPDHEAIFREAADTLKVVLWLQGRVGISQRTAGSDLPPALLSRHDRQVLKSGFRAILRLLEFTADRAWLEL